MRFRPDRSSDIHKDLSRVISCPRLHIMGFVDITECLCDNMLGGQLHMWKSVVMIRLATAMSCYDKRDDRRCFFSLSYPSNLCIFVLCTNYLDWSTYIHTDFPTVLRAADIDSSGCEMRDTLLRLPTHVGCLTVIVWAAIRFYIFTSLHSR